MRAISVQLVTVLVGHWALSADAYGAADFYWLEATGNGSPLPADVFDHGTIERMDFDDLHAGLRLDSQTVGTVTFGALPLATQALVATSASGTAPVSAPHLLEVRPYSDDVVTLTMTLAQPAARVSMALLGLQPQMAQVSVTLADGTAIPRFLPVGLTYPNHWLGVAADDDAITRLVLTTEVPQGYGYGVDDLQISYGAPEPATALLLLGLAGVWASFRRGDRNATRFCAMEPT